MKKSLTAVFLVVTVTASFAQTLSDDEVLLGRSICAGSDYAKPGTRPGARVYKPEYLEKCLAIDNIYKQRDLAAKTIKNDNDAKLNDIFKRSGETK